MDVCENSVAPDQIALVTICSVVSSHTGVFPVNIFA